MRFFLGAFVFLSFLTMVLNEACAVPPGGLASEFTSTDPNKAQLLEKHEGSASYLCAGRGKYQLLYQTSNGRSWLDLLVGETVVSLSRETFEACAGAHPKRADAVVEWRGVRRGKTFTPYALCFRMGSEEPGQKTTRETMVVVKLEGIRSRVVGHLAAGETKEAVHALVDRLCSQP